MTVHSGLRGSKARLAGVVAVATAVGLTIGALTGGSSPTVPTAGAAVKPNILFVLTDDLDLGEIAQMPIAAVEARRPRASRFSNNFVSVSLCCPSRSTTLRGQYSHNTGVKTNGGANGGFATAHANGIESSTVATWLHGAGYRTALIGKYLNGYPNTVGNTYVPPGWDEWYSSVKGNPYSEYNYTLNENGTLVLVRQPRPRTTAPTVYTKKTQDFVTRAAQAGKPFFAYLAVYAPHAPATPAPQDVNDFPGAHGAAHPELQRGRRQRQAAVGAGEAVAERGGPGQDRRAVPEAHPVAPGRRPRRSAS